MVATAGVNQGLSIGSFQAKTYFAELLRKVEEGFIVTITRNGHDVAVMQSPKKKESTEAQKAWQRLIKVSKTISSKNSSNPISVEQIQTWRNDGLR
ncbi:type II toxin-antitoxin system Phd/YefM family antitoxin [uncultured Treponema sp.]|uniref:type II toxin-antitoxin system Phd/YefM family antitoxin n=1 Tax=uncultured Treponema sp. TaxID=162155 RepID=UPI0025EFDC50|nr:type II toxin-antitoxin system Phd/YefM family antitoxin [uncultured Treponema sp.]